MTNLNTKLPKKVHAPASKSVSHRMLMGAALAQGESVISNVLESQDLMQTMEILSAAGAKFEKIDTGVYRVHGSSMLGNPDFNNPLSCNVHESGTSCRLLTAILATGQGYFYVHGAERMNERPIGTLTSTLEQLGSKFHFQKDGFPPFILFSNGLKGGEITISLEESSQYLSGLLLAAPLAKEAITIYIGGRHVVSWPYVGLTLQTMKAFGAQFDVSILDKTKTTSETKKWKAFDWHKLTEIIPGEIRFRIRPFKAATEPNGQNGQNGQDAQGEQNKQIGQNNDKTGYKAGSYTVEGDWSGASYLLAAGALGTTPITVQGLNRNSLQADKALLDILQEMKARVEYGNFAEQSITVYPSHLHAVEVNMADCPDIVPTIAVLASFAHGITKITGVEHLRIKECDRLTAMAEELKKAGIQVIEEQDGLIIHGLHPDKPMSQAILAAQSSTLYDLPSIEDEAGAEDRADEKGSVEDKAENDAKNDAKNDATDAIVVKTEECKTHETSKTEPNKTENGNAVTKQNTDNAACPQNDESAINIQSEQITPNQIAPKQVTPKQITELDFSNKNLSFKSYGDHRIVMSLSLFELAGAKVSFDDSSVISKSFPHFWDVWKQICE